MFLQVLLGILVLAVVIALFYFIGILKKVGGTLDNLQDLLTTAKNEMRPTIEEIRSSANDLKGLTANIDKKLEKTENFFEIVQDLSQTLKIPASIAGQVAEASAINLSSLSEGLKKGIKTFYDLSKKKEEKEKNEWKK